MGHTSMVSEMVAHSQIPSDAKDKLKIIRYIKLLSCVLIVIVAVCVANIGVLSWYVVRSVLCQDEVITRNELNAETEKLKIVSKNSSADIRELQSTVKSQEEVIRTLKMALKELSTETASTYIRWGRSDCPANGTELVYDGYVGGSWHLDKGGASNYVCLTTQPLWGHVQSGKQNYSVMHGAEYEFAGYASYGKDFFGKDLKDFDVPCAVCRTTRATVIMIPGRNRCFDGWTLEYHGYLTADFMNYLPTEYTCIDKSPTNASEANGNENGALFYLVEAVCGSLKCPPYIDGAELTCVVCSK